MHVPAHGKAECLSASATGFHQEETNNADMHLHQVVLRS